jgi:hypothetical protein
MRFLHDFFYRFYYAKRAAAVDGLELLRVLSAAGRDVLVGKTARDLRKVARQIERDAAGTPVSARWEPPPFEVGRRFLEGLGTFTVPPRLPDSGHLSFIIYVPGGRLILGVDEPHDDKSDPDKVTVDSVTFSTR